jgi:hypothetical protein
MELGLAQASFGGTAVLIGSYLPEHLPMYARYGYLKLPLTDLEMFDSVGQIAVAGICRTDRLPQPTRSHVDELLRSMRMNAAEHPTETDAASAFYDKERRAPAPAQPEW